MAKKRCPNYMEHDVYVYVAGAFRAAETKALRLPLFSLLSQAIQPEILSSTTKHMAM